MIYLNYKKVGILFLLFSQFFISIYAQQDFLPVEDAINLQKKIQEVSSKNQAMKSQFLQEKEIDYLGSTIEMSGNFYYRSDRKFRWEYKKPHNYIIVSNNGKFSTWDAVEEKTLTTPDNPILVTINDLILASISGNIENLDGYSISFFTNSENIKIELIPEIEKIREIYKKIEMFLDKETLEIERVRMVEINNDITIISFLDRKYPETLSDKLFTNIN